MATGLMPARALRSAAAGRDWATRLHLGGLVLFVAGAIILMGIITAEALYPGAYSTAANEISDLGGTRPPDSIINQPSATIFDVSMIVIGVLVITGSWFVHGSFGRRSVTLPITILGIGALGVGLFPGNTGNPHAVFAMLTFVSGGVAALSASRIATAPFRYVSVLLGAISLLTLLSYMILGEAGPMGGLGIGGVERWIVYPIVLWVTGFGGYLAGRADGGREAGASASA